MNLNFSRIIAGTMTWGSWGKQLDVREMGHFIDHCVENGISTFDHADIYGDYSTEADFGNALTDCSVNRSDIQIITKCGIQYTSPTRNNRIKHYNYSKDYIIWSVEESLKNLKIEYLDLFLLHRPSPLMHPDIVSEAIILLQTQGKIKQFGVSNFNPSQVDLISKNVEISANQIEFSITAHTAMYDGVLDQMILKKITPMAWSPLGNVFRENTEQTNRIHKELETLEAKYNATKDQLILAWILKHPAQFHPVIGTTDKNRIVSASKATTIDLELEDWFILLAASQGHKVP
jgi:predicted oxidoreductase